MSRKAFCWFQPSRNRLKMSHYKKALNQCMNPDCKRLPYQLDVHHIIPLKKGGADDYNNYIVLCKDCHSHNKFHHYGGDDKLQELLTYKFFMELHYIGVASDTENFEEVLIAYLRQKDKP